MIVCHCNVVRAEEIRTEVRLGASCPDEVAARCGAGARCGGCRFAIEDVIVDELTRAVLGVGARH
ncbi:MAG: (2Fe-2S)-binding protein [Acidimicrobiales bacterium]